MILLYRQICLIAVSHDILITTIIHLLNNALMSNHMEAGGSFASWAHIEGGWRVIDNVFYAESGGIAHITEVGGGLDEMISMDVVGASVGNVCD